MLKLGAMEVARSAACGCVRCLRMSLHYCADGGDQDYEADGASDDDKS